MDTIDETAINIYTDGSSYSHPRAGGIGIRIITVDVNGNEVIHDEQPLGFPGATNQQMELQACIEALQLLASRRSPVDLSHFSKIITKTDSAARGPVKGSCYGRFCNQSSRSPRTSSLRWSNTVRGTGTSNAIPTCAPKVRWCGSQ